MIVHMMPEEAFPAANHHFSLAPPRVRNKWIEELKDGMGKEKERKYHR